MNIFHKIKQLKLSGTKEFFHTRWIHAKNHLQNVQKNLHSRETLKQVQSIIEQKNYLNTIRYLSVFFAAYFSADTTSLITDSLIPEPPSVPAPVIARTQEVKKSIQEYAPITNRHIFNSEGLMPDEETNIAQGPARKTTLPFNLIGTIVLKDELKSIATIEDSSVNLIFPVRVDDTIVNKAKITKIEHLKVYFINQESGHLEYVEILEEPSKIQPAPLRKPSISTSSRTESGGIIKHDDSHYELERSVVTSAMSNLRDVLQQARAIPNFENGVPDGYKLIQITPNSIYDKLGLKDNDILCGINGDAINDPSKAFQLFNELKTSSHLDLCVKRNGQRSMVGYDIR